MSARGASPTPLARRRAVAVAVGAALACLAVVGGQTAAGAAGGNPHLTESAITKSGTGRFADLSVTVGKTQNLANEAIKVNWRWGGADPGSHTTANDTQWHHNYLSVFQCWGDAATGPDREQCQYGGQFGETDGINTRVSPFSSDPNKRFAVSRVVSPVVFGKVIPQAADPLEASERGGYPPSGSDPGVVPLHSAPTKSKPEGERVTAIETGAWFDKYGTNEVPLARTNADGTGSVFFEAQTVYESQFLGCGSRVGRASAETGRSCWLVVVPRDTIDANGEDVTSRTGIARSLYSSPLSLSNWRDRIAFPLGFDPVREPCAIGGVERPVVGHESLSVAISSWQGPLCANGQGFFYATTTDDIARSTVASELPKLSIVTDPLAPGAVEASKGAAVYAPVAASGVSISLFVERVYNSASDPKLRPYNGTRVEQLNLNPRLVAKLLTESYRESTWINNGGPEHLKGAPLSLLDDPEFKAINASSTLADDLLGLRNERSSLARLFVPPDASDAVRLLWEWVLGDAKARAFLAGEPDGHGMRVNKYYKGLARYQDPASGARADIPRLEEDCVELIVGSNVGEDVLKQRLCALDAAPYANNLDHGAALTARGQQLGGGSFVYDTLCTCVKIPRAEPQLVGQRALLALTDTPSSARRGLVAASLSNADGRYVAPSDAALAAALVQATDTRTAGVKRVDPKTVKASGYPLTRLSYAVTNPALLDQAAREDYAKFIEVVTTDGQRPGTRPGMLPTGYAPLTGAFQVQALNAARAIRTAKAPAPAAAPSDSLPTPDEEVTDPQAPLPGGDAAALGDDPGAAPLAAPAPVELPAAGPGIVPGAAPPATAGTSAPDQRPVSFTARIADMAPAWILPLLAALALLTGGAGRAMLWLGARRGPA